MRINTNMAALNAWRNMTTNEGNVQKSLEKLSSGFRINRAADDAAGLAVSEKMRAQIRGTNMAVRNAQDGISLVQTAEGALTETHSILQRQRELATQAATGTLNSDDVASIQSEFNSLTAEVDRIGNSTKFNGKNLLNGNMGATSSNVSGMASANGVASFNVDGAATGTGYTLVSAAGGTAGTLKFTLTDATGNKQIVDNVAAPATGQTSNVNFDKLGVSVTLNDQAASGMSGSFDVTNNGLTIQVGANNTSAEQMQITIGNMTTAAGGLNTASLNVTTITGAQTAMDRLDTAIKSVSTQRASLGATQNRLEHTVSSLQVTSENLSAAESRIRDVDMASEMANFTKNNILMQASQAMLAQANQGTQGILSLLR